MSTTDSAGANFAARLFEQLLPFQTLDTLGHLWALCDGIGAMFDPVESLTADRDDGLPGWATLLDADAIPIEYLGYLAQFVGVNLKPGLSDDDQRAWVKVKDGFDRGRPATIKSAVATTLTGSKTVILQERVPNPWRFTVITKPSETPDANATDQAIQSQKPGPDVAIHVMSESLDYEYVKDNVATYADLGTTYATYGDLTSAHT